MSIQAPASPQLSSPPLSDQARRLIERFRSRQAVIGVVGLGYVGLPLVRAMHGAGFSVVGFDIDHAKIEMLRKGESYLQHLGTGFVKDLSRSKKFTPTADPRDLASCDAVILCVPTPLNKYHEPDLSYVQSSAEMVAKVLHPGMLVSLESTSYPGTTREICGAALEAAGRKAGLACGEDYFLVFAPEREDPGRAGFETRTIPRLVGGVDPASTQVGHAMYAAAIEKVVAVESAEVAEAAKLLENIYRCVNIALVNELKPVLGAMGIDIWQVIKAASTKPFGFQPFYPGPGLGGHCIPIDPFYLTWKAREFGQVTRFIELAGEINRRMPELVVEKAVRAINEEGKSIRGAKVLICGLAYKPNIDDVRETPAAEIIKLLVERGAKLSYHDPHVPQFPEMRRYQFDMDSVTLTPELLASCDCVVIVTDHNATDWALIARHAPLVIDTRDAMSRVPPGRARVVKA